MTFPIASRANRLDSSRSHLLLDVTPLQIESSRLRGIGGYVRGLLSGLDNLGVQFGLWGFAKESIDGKTRVPDVGGRRIGSDAHLTWIQMLLWLGRGVPAGHLLHVTSPSATGVEHTLRVPYMVTVFDLIPFRFPESYQPARRHRLFYRRYLDHIRQATRVITISDAVRRDVLRLVDRRPSEVITTPLGCPELPAPSGWRWGHGVPYLLVAGTPDPHKNVEMVVRAMGSLPSDLRRPLVMTGYRTSGPWANLSQLAVELDVELVHLGYVSQQGLADLYAGTLGVLIPSLYEGFGLPALEALSIGAPLVVSEGGALPEVAGSAATILPFSVERWREEIRRLIEPEEPHDPGPGMEWASRFTWRRTAELTLEIYERLL